MMMKDMMKPSVMNTIEGPLAAYSIRGKTNNLRTARPEDEASIAEFGAIVVFWRKCNWGRRKKA
jgi:hypothetical protein